MTTALTTPHTPYLDISAEVAQALAYGSPVVALESTIISHGMPYPDNVHTALKVEDAVRAGGAIPATIAIVGGRLTVGLSPDQIETLGKTGRDAIKVSRRDMAMVVATQQTGATTVASTMLIAAMAGIRVFATGGIGGAHRGAQHSFDVSADLRFCVTCTSVSTCRALAWDSSFGVFWSNIDQYESM